MYRGPLAGYTKRTKPPPWYRRTRRGQRPYPPNPLRSCLRIISLIRSGGRTCPSFGAALSLRWWIAVQVGLREQAGGRAGVTQKGGEQMPC